MNPETTLDRLREIAEARQRIPCPDDRRQLRAAAGVSLAALASAAGVSSQTLLAWENGSSPRDAAAIRYAVALDILRSATAPRRDREES